MTLRKKDETKPTGGKVRTAAGGGRTKSGRTPTTGLAGFLLDASEASGKAAFASLAKTRPTFRGIAAGAAFGLKKMDPESAALSHLDHARKAIRSRSSPAPRSRRLRASSKVSAVRRCR
ncbi:MAG: hypothetical protein ACXWWG_07310 [Nitrospira sp.]